MHKPNLDVLRALAVCCVFLYHLALTLHAYTGFMSDRWLDAFGVIGHAGVLAFFVHTSLVLMYSLERMHRAGGRVAIAFYIRRLFRIYPLAIVVIVLALIFHFPSRTWETPDAITTHVIVANLLLVQNVFTGQQVVSPMWSLPFEVQMYVVLPMLFVVAKSRHAIIGLLLLFTGFCAIGIIVQIETGRLNMAAYIPCFLAGVLCYALRDRLQERITAYAWLPFLLVLFAGFTAAVSFSRTPVYFGGWMFCLVLGVGVNLFRESEVRLLNLATEKIALYAYGIYVLHVLALSIVFQHLGVRSVPLGSALFVLLTAMFAVVAFHVVESPMMDLGRRLSSYELFKPSPDPDSLEPAP